MLKHICARAHRSLGLGFYDVLGWGCFVGEGGGEVFGGGGGVPWFVGLSGGGRWRVRVRVISWWREGGLSRREDANDVGRS